jgi:hypothetical protein
MPDVQRTGRVGRYEFDLHLAAGALVVAAECGASLQDIGDDGALRDAGEEEVDETRTRDGDPGHPRRLRQGADDQLGDLARWAARGLGEGHREVAGQVAVGFIPGVLDLDLGRPRRQDVLRQYIGGLQVCQRLAEQFGDMGFHIDELPRVKWKKGSSERRLLSPFIAGAAR